MRDMGPDTLSGERILQTRGMRYAVGGQALIDGLDLDIRAGRRTVIMGPNGAGKSVLLRLLHGLITPTDGSVLWRGQPLDAKARKAQAMVFQRPVMLRRSAKSNLRFALGLRGLGRAERRRREAEALARAGLSDVADRAARVLSGGEQQRLAVARALSHHPSLLFLDEPTASLDPSATAAVETLIRDASAEGVTIMLVTHDVGQARRLGEDLVFLDAGRIAEQGPIDLTLDAPRSAPLRAWLDGRLYLSPDRRAR